MPMVRRSFNNGQSFDPKNPMLQDLILDGILPRSLTQPPPLHQHALPRSSTHHRIASDHVVHWSLNQAYLFMPSTCTGPSPMNHSHLSSPKKKQTNPKFNTCSTRPRQVPHVCLLFHTPCVPHTIGTKALSHHTSRTSSPPMMQIEPHSTHVGTTLRETSVHTILSTAHHKGSDHRSKYSPLTSASTTHHFT
jgi:hypothetical protein